MRYVGLGRFLHLLVLNSISQLMQTGGDVMHNCFVHVQGATAILKHLDYTDHEEKTFLRAMLIRQKWAAVSTPTSLVQS